MLTNHRSSKASLLPCDRIIVQRATLASMLQTLARTAINRRRISRSMQPRRSAPAATCGPEAPANPMCWPRLLSAAQVGNELGSGAGVRSRVIYLELLPSQYAGLAGRLLLGLGSGFGTGLGLLSGLPGAPAKPTCWPRRPSAARPAGPPSPRRPAADPCRRVCRRLCPRLTRGRWSARRSDDRCCPCAQAEASL